MQEIELIKLDGQIHALEHCRCFVEVGTVWWYINWKVVSGSTETTQKHLKSRQSVVFVSTQEKGAKEQ